MTFGSLSVVGISETTQAEQSLVDEHGEMTPGYFDGYKVGTFNSDSVVLYDTPDETNYLSMTTITGYSGAEVEFGTYYTYKDGFVVYEIQATNNTPEELKTTLEYYCYVSAADITISGETEEPEVINTCAICGTENCTTQHLYCEEHSKFDCTENHEKAEPTKPLTEAVIPENLTFTPDADVCIADAKGNKVTSSFELPAGTQASLSAWPAGDAYQWQIKDKDGNWMDIRGKDQRGLLFSGALFADANAQPVIRCEVTVGGEVKHSAEIRVNVTTPAAEASLLSVARAADPVVTAVETRAQDQFDVVINYQFANGELVASSHTATLAVGTPYSATVANPTIMGYKPTQGVEAAWNDKVVFAEDKVTFKITAIQEPVTVTVVYQPTIVNYTVIHYWQNIDNDNYSIKETETKVGLTGSTVTDVAKAYDGMYALLYEKPAIAADGSTVVEVYYDRNYYLMLFELDGGYGVEPIYARYGADIGEVGIPTKAGYSFLGWSLDGTSKVELPDTMPAENRTYKALWKMGDSAKVNIVFYGQNPNDDGYSYLQTGEVMATPGTEYTYTHGTQTYLYCELPEHNHATSGCTTICGKTEHTTHTVDCLGNCDHPTHTLACYSVQDSFELENTSKPDQITIQNPVSGTVYSYSEYFGQVSYHYLYLSGEWYRSKAGTEWYEPAGIKSITLDCDHTHTDKCYNCEYHEHSAACYDCGLEEHTHTSTGAGACTGTVTGLDSTLWTFKSSETATVEADGSTTIKVYYDRVTYNVEFHSNQNCTNEYTNLRITAKWGQSILDKWPTYNGSSSWLVQGKSNTWQNSIQIMPVGGAKFWGPKTGSSSYKAYYYVEALSGDTDTFVHNGVTYKLHHTDISSSSGNVTDEERYAIEGFTYKEGTANGQSYNNAKFYYTRHKYAIEFYSPTTLLKKTENVPYQSPLSSYDWTPDASQAPTQYEPGSVIFEGWYLDPQCAGEKYDFTDKTMPVGTKDGDTTLVLYANWVPVTRTVTFYFDYATLQATGAPFATATVPHGSKLENVPDAPPNGDYDFIGWFYLNDDGKETAFDFDNMQVTKDMKVYAKWSSNVLKEYTVYYKAITETDAEGNPVAGIEIADPSTGSAKAGLTKTFDAKGGEELYPLYQEGYFPLVESHSMTLNIEHNHNEGDNTFTFWYVSAAAVPYTVYYVAETLKEGDEGKGTITRDDKTYYIIAETYTNNGNRKAVVTENFEVVTGYMPDAYQKRLVVTTGGTDADNDGVEDQNVIVFYYTVDTEHAYYKITHYTQNTDGKTWTEHASSQAQGVIGETYSANPLTIDGFTYDQNVEGTVVSGKLTANGLELKLYYIRNKYPYEVRYWEKDTGKQLAEPKKETGLYGAVVSETAIDIPGYTAVEPTSQTLTIRIEEDEYGEPLTTPTMNIIYFYYAEIPATINYIPVTSDGGTVSLGSEKIGAVTGTAQGATPTAKDNYTFVGWYTDESCTTPVNVAWVDQTTKKITPQKTKDYDDGTDVLMGYESATYYALFELDVADLTITKQVTAAADGSTAPVETFTVKVTLTKADGPYTYTSNQVAGGTLNLTDGVGTLSIVAGETITIKDIVIGTDYMVEEINVPSYFQASDATDGKIGASENAVNITNTYLTGSLTITKEVVGDTTNVVPGDEFEFTVQLSNKQDEYSFTGSKTGTVSRTKNTVKLKAGESITITGIPLGTDFTVTETANPNYTQLPSDPVTGKIEDDSKAEFTNTYLRGDLQITKTVTGNAPTGDEFTFTIELTGKELDGTEINGEYGNVTFRNGTATVKLQKDGSITIKGLPGGVAYKISEDAALGYTPDKSIAEGKITAGAVRVESFTNVYKTGELIVSKDVVGDTAPDAAFTFTLGLRYNGSDITPAIKLNGTAVDWKGSTSYTFSVPKDDLVTFSDIPDGATYTVTEVTSDDFAYTTTVDVNDTDAAATAATGTLNVATRLTEEVAFTNTYTKGDLQITKQVVNDTGFTPTVSEFVIQVVLEGTNLNTAGYTVEGLATGKEVTWSGSATKLTAEIPVTATLGTPATVTIKHLPAGTEYTVTESAPVGYTASYDKQSGSITAGSVEVVTVTNTYKVGSLSVTKTVDGEVTEAYPSVFNFTLGLSNGVPVTNCKIQIADGETITMPDNGQFTLATGQTAIITGIPDGVTYTVTETLIPDYFTTTATGENATENVVSGTVEDNGTDTADFTNTARTSDLTIEKNGMNSTNESAIVEVTVAGKTYMVVLNNANHWKAVIAGLPIGATYSATETSWTWRYTGTVSGGGTINKTEGTSKITVSNSPNGDKWLHDEDSKTNIFGTN